MSEQDTPNEEGSKPAYIPPHLRGKKPGDPPASSVPYTVLKQYFSSREIGQHYGAPQAGTLNSSVNNPKELAYIFIFMNQHPQYPPKIFIKSNLDLIFKDAEKGGEMNPVLEDLEFPVFEEERRGTFRFKSWAKVKQVERLEKGSDALIDMLTEKWKRDTPRRGGWEREREREKSKNGPDVKVFKTTEVGENGEERVTETVVFEKDDDNDEDDKNLNTTATSIATAVASEILVAQKWENTRHRSQSAWKTSLSVDWAIVTLEFLDSEKGNPLHGPPIKRTAKAKVDTDSPKVSSPTGETDANIEQLSRSTGNISIDDFKKPKKDTEESKKNTRSTNHHGEEKVSLSKALQMDGATADNDDTLLVNDDCDAASIPSSPVLEPVTPKKVSVLNLSAYGLADPKDYKSPDASGYVVATAAQRQPQQSDISQSYISTGMGESLVDDFGGISAAASETDESDRWSELSEHDKFEDRQWMAVERNGAAKEVS